MPTPNGYGYDVSPNPPRREPPVPQGLPSSRAGTTSSNKPAPPASYKTPLPSDIPNTSTSTTASIKPANAQASTTSPARPKTPPVNRAPPASPPPFAKKQQNTATNATSAPASLNNSRPRNSSSSSSSRSKQQAPPLPPSRKVNAQTSIPAGVASTTQTQPAAVARRVPQSTDRPIPTKRPSEIKREAAAAASLSAPLTPGVSRKQQSSLSANASPRTNHRLTDAVSPGTSNITRGLINLPGENMCFLNVLVQILFHLDSFRVGLHSITNHVCPFPDKDSCVLSSLQVMFTEYEFGGEGELKAEGLLKALRLQYQHTGRFQPKDMDDAAETFEAVCTCIHACLTGNIDKDQQMYCENPCFVHDLFSVSVEEKRKCKCGGTKTSSKYEKLVNYISTTALVQVAKGVRANGVANPSDMNRLAEQSKAFSSNRFSAITMDDIIPMDQIVSALVTPDPVKCDKCSLQVPAQLYQIGTVPTCVVFGLIWERNIDYHDITRVLEQVQPIIDLNKLYGHEQGRHGSTPMLCHAMVCYYGQHYVSYFYSTSESKWFQVDDVRIREVGPSWSYLLRDCTKGKFQPVLTFYQTCSSEDAKQAGVEYMADMENYFQWKADEAVFEESRAIAPVQDLPSAVEMSQPTDANITDQLQIEAEMAARELMEMQDLALALDMQEREETQSNPLPTQRRSTTDSTIVYSGTLLVHAKSGLIKRDWRRRTVSLQDGNLAIIKPGQGNEETLSDTRDFKIYGVQKYVVVDDSGLKKYRKSTQPYRFQIKDQNSKVIGTFAAENADDKQTWLEILGAVGCRVRLVED